MEKQVFFLMAAILNIATNGGSIKISGCFHQHSEIVWHGGHLCQISYFCPDVKMYYIKSPHYWTVQSIDEFSQCCIDAQSERIELPTEHISDIDTSEEWRRSWVHLEKPVITHDVINRVT